MSMPPGDLTAGASEDTKIGRTSLAPVLLYALVALLFIPVYPHFVSPNEFSRWAVAASFVEAGSVEISPVLPILGNRLEDLSSIEGRTYSNKAPGAALVSLPGYLLARVVAGGPSADSLRPSLYAMRWFGATLPTLFLALFFRRIAASIGISDGQSKAVLLALLFGTPLFAYGLLLFSHALVAAALFIAWALLFHEWGDEKASRREFAAGALLGLAVISEYPAALPALIIFLGSMFRGNMVRVVRVILGALPFALILAIYNFQAFGSPWVLSSAFERDESFRSMASSGLFGIRFPSPSIFFQLLFSPARGLLVFSPVLIAAAFAVPYAVRRMRQDAAWTLILAPLSMLVLYAGYPNWHGGWTVGSRYLVAVIPFFVFPLLFRTWNRFDQFLLGASILASVGTTIVFPFVPPSFPFPWYSFSLPLLRFGLVIPNAGHLAGFAGAFCVCVTIAALAIWIHGRRGLFWLFGGMALWMLLGVAGSSLTPVTAELQRGYIAEVYFEQRGFLQRGGGSEVMPARLRQRMQYERGLPPTSWPFW